MANVWDSPELESMLEWEEAGKRYCWKLQVRGTEHALLIGPKGKETLDRHRKFGSPEAARRSAKKQWLEKSEELRSRSGRGMRLVRMFTGPLGGVTRPASAPRPKPAFSSDVLRRLVHADARVELEGRHHALAVFDWSALAKMGEDGYSYQDQIFDYHLSAVSSGRVRAGEWIPFAVVGLLGWTWKDGGFEESGAAGTLLLDRPRDDGRFPVLWDIGGSIRVVADDPKDLRLWVHEERERRASAEQRPRGTSARKQTAKKNASRKKTAAKKKNASSRAPRGAASKR